MVECSVLLLLLLLLLLLHMWKDLVLILPPIEHFITLSVEGALLRKVRTMTQLTSFRRFLF
jgi:hypothetical protein